MNEMMKARAEKTRTIVCADPKTGAVVKSYQGLYVVDDAGRDPNRPRVAHVVIPRVGGFELVHIYSGKVQASRCALTRGYVVSLAA